MASYETPRWIFGLNLLVERETAGGAQQWGYAAGARRTLTDQAATGLEVTRSFEGDKEGEVLVGIFVDPLPWLTINVGVGTGFSCGADITVRSAFVFRLR